jgi:hypothetical protein
VQTGEASSERHSQPASPRSERSKMKIPIFYEGSVRPVGEFNLDTKTFTRRLHSSRHFLKTPPAICFQDSIIKQIKDLGCQSIKVIDSDSGDFYEVDFTTFQEKSILVNRGYGLQCALPLNYWNSEYKRRRSKTLDIMQRHTETPIPGISQPALFQ